LLILAAAYGVLRRRPVIARGHGAQAL
jgi:hypothetical protein